MVMYCAPPCFPILYWKLVAVIGPKLSVNLSSMEWIRATGMKRNRSL